MFERYTEAARRSVFFARYEASQFGSKYIEAEHLLLGLLRESDAVFRPLFQSPDAPEAIRKEYEERLPERPAVSTSVDLPLNQQAKRVLTYSEEEADRLGHRHIGVEHLMLGLMLEAGSAAEATLRRYGMTLDALRAAAQETASQAEIPGPAGLRRRLVVTAGRPDLHRLLATLEPDRLHAAAVVLEALGKEVVTVTVVSPDGSFEFKFGQD